MAPNAKSDDEQKSLVFISRLSKAERRHLYSFCDAFPVPGVRDSFLRLVKQVSYDRLIRAEGCLEVAEELAKQEENPEALRTSVTKAWYSIHHSIRAMVLARRQHEADGHREGIKELGCLLEDDAFQRLSGLTSDDLKLLAEARDNRSVADYSPYDFSRHDQAEPRLLSPATAAEPTPDPVQLKDGQKGVSWITITDKMWKAAAQHNINVAQKLLAAADKVWRDSK